ncbi:MAG: DR2241 family protein [Chloroflexota bacterium]|nr:DR2241 family protein [Chloroflexota bacterium]MDE2948505.1 DR2241 family protein [Chloroflexota bacterium]
MSGIALILAGHGSHVSANTAGVVWAYVDRLRSWGAADEITACFWKEAPAFSQVLDTVLADDVVIVPVFTARGYFTSEVIPIELGLDGNASEHNGKRIQLTRPIGEHPRLRSIVDNRLRETIEEYELPPADTAVAIIGHGTRRHRGSRDTAREQALRIRRLNWFREVVDVYLDDEPAIPSVYRDTRAANIIALPYFLADGSHVRQDLPRALGISDLDAANCVNGRRVFYCEPVGSHESICQAILDLAREAGLPFAERKPPSAWRGFPIAGRSALLHTLARQKTLQFGQVKVDRRRVWHSDNRTEGKTFTSPAALRAFLRDDPFRPLATSADLPAGWQVPLDAPEQAHAVLETLYPGLIADWAASKRGALKTDALKAIGKRQNGLFQDIHRLPVNVIKMALDKVCGGCVRRPTWWPDAAQAGKDLPCRSACNLWLSTARQMGEAKL